MIKKGVDLSKLQPQMVLAVTVAEVLFKQHGYNLEITGGAEKVKGRSPNSLHYKGLALDFNTNRTFPHPNKAKMMVRLLSEALGPQYRVIFEPTHKIGDITIVEHIHVEFKNGIEKQNTMP